ncbi:MAG TPA: exodeoxyribonuclease VII small subunit [Dissulfurispiraceae bacterium]|jgi:exodeoxyribonuclease VII small subunit|nr:exodeoxyribonuclease VII small subunit [Dissulfurispiraceae bacterium]
MKKGTKETYTQAITELEAIIAELEAGAVDVDLLAEKTKRALYLVELCRAKLSQTENEVKGVLRRLDQGTESQAGDTVNHDLGL